MSTAELLAELERRGLKIELAAEGRPVLRGKKEEATPALLRALKWHREAIVERLQPAPRREWLWPGGMQITEEPGWASWGLHDSHPSGAMWWRPVGEEAWRAIPGRQGVQQPEAA